MKRYLIPRDIDMSYVSALFGYNETMDSYIGGIWDGTPTESDTAIIIGPNYWPAHLLKEVPAEVYDLEKFFEL